MTVGREVARQSEFRLFHNHALIEPLLEVFNYGTPPFNRLLADWRAGVVEEAALSGTDLLFTFVWGLELQADADELRKYIRPYVEKGAEVAFVELAADLDTRLQRNRTELRLAEKRSKRNVEWSDANVREMERFLMNTDLDASLDRSLPASASWLNTGICGWTTAISHRRKLLLEFSPGWTAPQRSACSSRVGSPQIPGNTAEGRLSCRGVGMSQREKCSAT